MTVKKGDTVAFDGHLVKTERLVKLVKAEKSNIVLSDLRLADEAIIDYHKEDAMQQRQKLSAAKFDSYLNVLGAFLVGVLATSVAMRVNNEINR